MSININSVLSNVFDAPSKYVCKCCGSVVLAGEERVEDGKDHCPICNAIFAGFVFTKKSRENLFYRAIA